MLVNSQEKYAELDKVSAANKGQGGAVMRTLQAAQDIFGHVPMDVQIKIAEGEAILSRLTPAMDVILLDEHGREFRSIEYADWLQKKMNAGRDLTLVIGGAYGFSPAVYQRANGQISLSQMTFSHQMIRIMAIEQIYRAMTILRGEPYHHE